MLAKFLQENPLGAFAHHAYLVLGAPEETLPILQNFLAARPTISHTTLAGFEEGVFGQPNARELLELAQRTAFGESERKVIIVPLISIRREAEQALLKTLEEPPLGTHFFFLTSSTRIFAPTILSRFYLIHYTNKIKAPAAALASDFLQSDPEARLALVKRWLDPEVTPNFSLPDFLNQLELALPRAALKALYRVRALVGPETLAVPRLLLEHLALVLPESAKRNKI